MTLMRMHKRLVGKMIDADANLLHPDLFSSLSYHVDNAMKRNVAMFVIPGSTLADTVGAVELMRSDPRRYVATAGVHPYNTQTCQFTDESKNRLESILVDANSCSTQHMPNATVCVGECGLDYSAGFPAPEYQLPWFTHQVSLAHQLNLPMYLHVREAHTELIEVLDSVFTPHTAAPKVLNSSGTVATSTATPTLRAIVHCFTGTYDELCCYLDRGMYIGLTGFIMSHTATLSASTSTDFKGLDSPRDAEMRRWLQRITLERLLIETDAPYMGFPGCRVGETADSPTPVNAKAAKRNLTQKYPNVPSSLVLLVRYIAALTEWTEADIVHHTTTNAIRFFEIKS